YIDGGDAIDIFDTSGGRITSYGELLQVRWSAHHSGILFREYHGLNSICIYDDILAARRAYDCETLETWQDRQHTKILDYQWSLDGKKVIFNYVQDDQKGGGLCIVDAEDVKKLHIDCPIKKTVTNGSFNGVYYPQPANTYGYFSYNTGLIMGESSDADLLRETGLCLLNQTDYTVDCVSDHVLPADTYYDRAAMSPSGHMLAMLYTGQHFERHDGACFIDLQTGKVVCPDSSVTYTFADTYGWSPDSRFFLVIFTSTGVYSDDKTGASAGLYDVEAGTYRDEGSVTFENNVNPLWRPALQP
ncbi:MAG TPA: hypothetical protein VHL11_11175, partial [Phototrophicaceae bacterium]|nr:hypothetical protein [Phototrophicaceae bacterium]